MPPTGVQWGCKMDRKNKKQGKETYWHPNVLILKHVRAYEGAGHNWLHLWKFRQTKNGNVLESIDRMQSQSWACCLLRVKAEPIDCFPLVKYGENLHLHFLSLLKRSCGMPSKIYHIELCTLYLPQYLEAKAWPKARGLSQDCMIVEYDLNKSFVETGMKLKGIWQLNALALPTAMITSPTPEEVRKRLFKPIIFARRCSRLFNLWRLVT